MAEDKKHEEDSPIEEGEARWPWWAWGVAIIWIIYAFFIAPFEISWPL